METADQCSLRQRKKTEANYSIEIDFVFCFVFHVSCKPKHAKWPKDRKTVLCFTVRFEVRPEKPLLLKLKLCTNKSVQSN